MSFSSFSAYGWPTSPRIIGILKEAANLIIIISFFLHTLSQLNYEEK